MCFIKCQLPVSVWDILESAECRCEGMGQVQWEHERKLKLRYSRKRKLIGEPFRKLFGGWGKVLNKEASQLTGFCLEPLVCDVVNQYRQH